MFRGQIEENHGEDASLLYAVGDAEFLRWLSLREHPACHAIMEQLDEGAKLVAKVVGPLIRV